MNTTDPSEWDERDALAAALFSSSSDDEVVQQEFGQSTAERRDRDQQARSFWFGADDT